MDGQKRPEELRVLLMAIKILMVLMMVRRNDFKREVLASQAVQSINDPLHTRAAGVFKHGYYTLPMGSWQMSTCVFASMQGFTDMVALHAYKYTCGQSLGAHDFA